MVASGCTDNTVQIASAFGNNVWVIDIPAGSKRRALLAGDAAAAGYPRIYLDADVDVGSATSRPSSRSWPGRACWRPCLNAPLALDRCTRAVRWYYDIWLRLPDVRRGLFGRGVLGVSEAGHERLAGDAGDRGGRPRRVSVLRSRRARVVAGARASAPCPGRSSLCCAIAAAWPGKFRGLRQAHADRSPVRLVAVRQACWTSSVASREPRQQRPCSCS